MSSRPPFVMVVITLLTLGAACSDDHGDSVPRVLRGLDVPETCADPAPIIGLPDPRVPDRYIVGFVDGVEAAAETARLASKYGFIPIFVYTGNAGFYAQLSDDVVTALTCEDTILHIIHDHLLVPL